MSRSVTKPRFDALTSVRFFAALHVVLYHEFHVNVAKWAQRLVGLSAHWPQWAQMVPRGLAALAVGVVSSGYVSVTLFFILSGFILAYNYLDADGELTASPRSFWIARFARIYPTYLLGLVLVAPFALSHPTPPPHWLYVSKTGLASLLLVQAWWPTWANVWNGPGWSLSAEAFFYFLFPWVSVWLFRGAARRRVQISAAACVMTMVSIAAVRYGLRWDVSIEKTPVRPMLPIYPLARLPEFLLGIAIGRLFVLRQQDPSQHPMAASPRWQVPVGIVGTLLVLSFADVGAWPVARIGLLATLFAILIYGLAVGDVSTPTPLIRLMGWGPLVLLGEASYAIYIIHVPLAKWFGKLPHGFWVRAAHTSHVLDAGAVEALTYLAFTITMAVLIFIYLETPSRLWMRARLQGISRGNRVVDDAPGSVSTLEAAAGSFFPISSGNALGHSDKGA